MRRLFGIISVFFLFTCSGAQVVNVESMRMHTDTVRFAGNANFTFSYQENNGLSLLTLKSAMASQIKSKSLNDILMMIGNVDFTKTSTTDLSNAAFGHLRYNHKFNAWLRWEVFSQVQYNKLLSVGLRLLNGSGPRVKWLNRKNAACYFGSLYMFEYEETSGSDNLINRHHRLSNYLTISCNLPKMNGEFVSTTYFQPRIDVFRDFRFMNQTSLAFTLFSKVKLITAFSFLYDEFPPDGVAKRALALDQGIRIDF